LNTSDRAVQVDGMSTSITIRANDLSFHVQTAGDPSAPLILFLHGFPEYSGAWDEMLARLSDQFFCVAPDQRGYGQSDKTEGVKSYPAGHSRRTQRRS